MGVKMLEIIGTTHFLNSVIMHNRLSLIVIFYVDGFLSTKTETFFLVAERE
jgi:hypothetical protein